MQYADAAMYRAKRSARGAHVFWDAERRQRFQLNQPLRATFQWSMR